MKRRPNLTFLVFGLLGGFLFIDLVLPIASLFLGADWAGWIAALRQPAALQALMISIEASAISMAIMTLLGVPLGYLLARAHLPLKRMWISLVFLPMVVPDLAAGILLLKTFGPYGVIGQPLEASEPPSREEDGAAQMGARAPLGVTESLTLRPKSACANTRAGAHRVSRRT